MALAEKPTSVQFKVNQIAGYKLALLKVQTAPLGVRLYNTTQYVTPSIIFRVITLVSSFFVFIQANNSYQK
jgi:hypothetical protein